MAPFIAPPEPLALLPPFLACLPTAFCAAQPPPALLPLLSPILRQRVQFLAHSDSSSASRGSWLSLLCWDPSKAAALVTKIEETTFEPHPVSGEIELGDVGVPVFRRKDEETLQSLLKVPDLGLMVIYVWCENDPAGGGPGWRVSELRLLDLAAFEHDKPEWVESVGKANAQFDRSRPLASTPRDAAVQLPSSGQTVQSREEADDDDDDYWAMYDATPGRSPANKRSPAPDFASSGPNHVRTASEDEYFARYGNVQPEMDNHDPSVDQKAIGQSSLHGDVVAGHRQKLASHQEHEQDEAEPRNGLVAPINGGGAAEPEPLVHTRPSSSSGASAVAQLEKAASHQSQSEMAIQQHIGTSVKSLWRLARVSGIETAEFKRLVRTELDVLDLLEAEG